MKDYTLPTGFIVTSDVTDDKYFAYVSTKPKSKEDQMEHLMTKAELDELNNEKSRQRMRKEEDQQLERYFNAISKIASEEDYLRATMESLESEYDGYDFKELTIRTYDNIPEEIRKISSLKQLDKTVRKGKPINVLKLIGYLASIKEIREIIYNNPHGIVVRDPKRDNYPEKVVMETLKEIIVEGLTSIHCYEQEIATMFLESSPVDSIAGKINKLIPTIKFNESPDALDHTSVIEEETIVEIIPKEDKKFWSDIYRSKEIYEYEGKQFYALNERTLGKLFQIA